MNISVSNRAESLAEAATTVRGLAIDMVEKANSGHPGMPLGMADVAVVLWKNYLMHNPTNPTWFNRDRFVLSGGHGSALLYSLLHLTGYDLSIDDLKQFRQWRSKTPGHPEYHDTPGVETTTGPLGQGIANAVGMALAEKSLGARYNRPEAQPIDHYTYVFCGDGDLQEGVAHEAVALAATWQLGKLILFYDDNNITIDGPTELSFTEDVLARFEAYGWQVLRADGHQMPQIAQAIDQARADQQRPTIIACKTIIGFGSPNKQGTHHVHGAPLGADELRRTKENLGLDPASSFAVSASAAAFLNNQQAGQQAEKAWLQIWATYQQAHPQLANELQRLIDKQYGQSWIDHLPQFDTHMATRQASGAVLNALVPHIPHLVGGSADLSPSNNTFAKGLKAFSASEPDGRYLHYGVREHGMASIMNGMALHGGVLPYAGTFFVFADYMRPAIRMAALMRQQVIYVFTHDSIGLGEDGPTHQPVEHLAALRIMPNVTVFRPADANETAIGWKVAIENTTGPTALVLSRQTLHTVDRSVCAPASQAERGAYVLMQDAEPQLSLFASGSEVEILLKAKEMLNAKGVGVRVISFPSFELFDKQDLDYQDELVGDLPKIAIEAAVTFSWHKYLAGDAIIIGIDEFGSSAPYQTLYENYGITAENILLAAEQLIEW